MASLLIKRGYFMMNVWFNKTYMGIGCLVIAVLLSSYIYYIHIQFNNMLSYRVLVESELKENLTLASVFQRSGSRKYIMKIILKNGNEEFYNKLLEKEMSVNSAYKVTLYIENRPIVRRVVLSKFKPLKWYNKYGYYIVLFDLPEVIHNENARCQISVLKLDKTIEAIYGPSTIVLEERGHY